MQKLKAKLVFEKFTITLNKREVETLRVTPTVTHNTIRWKQRSLRERGIVRKHLTERPSA